MCGFAGFLTYRNQGRSYAERQQILHAMGKAIGHRGPDDEQIFDDGTLSLIYRRLAIVAPETGRQPLFSEDGDTLLVANGEIYNHAELRQQLRPWHQFSSPSDCEVILHGFEEWGAHVFSRCRGMFALAVWERKTKRLTLTRDRLGIKPLYFCELPDGLLFGSELKALLAHPDCPKKVHLQSHSIGGPYPANTPTYLHEVQFLQAATYLSIRPDARPARNVFWSIDPHLGSAPFGEDEAKYIESYGEIIVESSREHLQGQSAAALHLSGGLDSALLAGLMSRHNRDLPCFTIVERTTCQAGDVNAAGELTRKLGLPWYPVLFDFRTLVQDLDFGLARLEESVWMMDSPRFDLEWVFKEELSRLICDQRPDAKILIIGQGADEFSGGYSKRIGGEARSWQDYLDQEIAPMLSSHPALHDAPGAHAESRTAPYHQAMKMFIRQLQHHNLWHEDRTSAWLNLEARVPFLDHRLIELLASIPESLHSSLFWNKKIVRQSARQLVPELDPQRPKVGFCWTADTRSLDIVLHGMAARIIPEFLDKYADSLPPGKMKIELVELCRDVMQRKPHFYENSLLVLRQMSEIIFNAFIHRAPDLENSYLRQSGLAILQPDDLADISQSLLKQPVVEGNWQASDIPVLPPETRIEILKEDSHYDHFALMHQDEACSHLAIPKKSAWMRLLLQKLGDEESFRFSLNDWQHEFKLSEKEIHHFFDALYQAGFALRSRPGASGNDHPDTVVALAPEKDKVCC